MQMSTFDTTHSLLHRTCWIRRVLLCVGLLCILAWTTLGNALTAHADSIPGGNVTDPTVRAVDIATPAVVRIFTLVTSHVLVTFSTGAVSFPQTGSGYQLQVSGSGTFISAHGDIVTADHVVNPPTSDSSVQQAFINKAAPDITAYMNQHNGTQVTQDQVSQQMQNGQLPFQIQYDNKASEVFLSTDYTGPLTAGDMQSVPAQIHATVDKIEKESAFDQKDVAIIHVPLNDMASVQLGDSSTVQPQDALTIIGFPGNGDVSSTPQNVLTSSINKINVSSIKTTNTGAPVIQVGGNVEQGDSGGPAINSNGTVVGIVSFGISSPGAPAGTSFLQASNSATALVKSLNIDTTPGTFEQRWSQAFADYAATTTGHWTKAKQEFQQLATTYPLFKAITPYLNYASTQAAKEPVATSQTQTQTTAAHTVNTVGQVSFIAIAWTVGAVVVFLLLVVLLFRAGVRGRKKDKTASTQGIPSTRQGTLPSASSSPQDKTYTSAMSAFGAPAQTSAPTQAGQTPAATTTSNVLRPWPCGHLNRSNARFCSVCGEPAPLLRRAEQ